MKKLLALAAAASFAFGIGAAQAKDLIVATEYGGMPPRPEKVEFETLCRSAVARWEGSPNFWSCKIHCAGGEKPISLR